MLGDIDKYVWSQLYHQAYYSCTLLCLALRFRHLGFALIMGRVLTCGNLYLIFSCDQAALWMVQSVCLSACPSVRPSVRPFVTPFSPCSHHCIIMKFSGVITNDKSDVHAKGRGQTSKVKVTEVTTQLNRFQTVTPVWIHIWWWNYAYSLIMLRKGALLFSRSSVKFQGHTAAKIVEFDPDWAFPDCNSSFNSPMATKCWTKLEVA